MTIRSFVTAAIVSTVVALPSAQAPALVDTSKLGPQVGSQVPAFSGIDQFGTPRSLTSVMGPKGAMLVFFRSADW